ncbi:PREDICTED: NAC domain-containing protein 66-like [Prunus mume]|uniref:NAC domain-containing protein 66-like n=1 Tax=Prunus mume TaxID=102107 RepID=A0ABM1LM93_PRUMU|nr:PREDICTED: NAC domain-containing protein 66-like [Prunus mume]
MGGYQVPVGYRFTPSEEELLLHYLLPRVNGNDYPKGVVPDCDLYGTKEPWDIWRDFHHSSADDQEDIYVFTTLKKKTPNGSRFCRTVGAAGTGGWKGEDSGKKIRACGNDIGIRKRFRYMNPGSPHDDRWIMLEFQLHESLKETSGKSKLEERKNHEVDMASRGEIQAQHVHDDQQQHIDASTYDQLRVFEDFLMNDVEGEQDTMVNPTLLAHFACTVRSAGHKY